ncbi:MAG: hypothetical protein QGG40_07050 [Myxococcota bacterium]|jgi:hypothetical protein|nr:hypothetical protein [Myxococcota bacterium]
MNQTMDERVDEMQQEIAGIRAELQHHRKRARRATACVWILAGTVSSALLMGQDVPDPGDSVEDSVTDTIRTRQLEVVDGQDRVRAVISADGPSFALADEQGNARLTLSLLTTGPAVVLSDREGSNRVVLTEDFDDGPGLSLLDEEERARATLSVHADGPRLSLADGDRILRTLVASQAGQAALAVYDETGKQAFVAP